MVAVIRTNEDMVVSNANILNVSHSIEAQAPNSPPILANGGGCYQWTDSLVSICLPQGTLTPRVSTHEDNLRPIRGGVEGDPPITNRDVYRFR